jgi:hypothetical protein
MITQEQLDKISDDFQSTFTKTGDNKISNCMHPYEVDTVNEIIKKHTNFKESLFIKVCDLSNDYWIYEIELN